MADHETDEPSEDGASDEALAALSGSAIPRRSVKRNVGVLLATQMVTWSISLVLVVALPRFLGSAAMGQFRLVSSVWMIAAVFTRLGTDTLVTLEIARKQFSGISIVAPTMLARTLAFVSVSGVVAAFVSLAGYRSDVATLFMIVGLATLVTSLGATATAALQGLEDFSLPSLANIVDKLLSTVVILIALFLGAGVHAVAVIIVGSACVQTILLFRFLRRYATIGLRTTFRQAAVVARRGAPFLFGAFAITGYQNLDTIVMSLLVEDEQIGWYAAADRLTSTSLFIPTIVMSALLPTLARLHQEDVGAARSLVDRGFRTMLLLSIPIGLGLAAISSPLTLLLFGEEFRESGPVLAVLSVVVVLMFHTILIGNYAVATGREKFFFSLIFVALLATIPLDLVLIPWTNRVFDNGAIGGALAYIVTETVILVVSVTRLAPHLLNRATAVRFLKCGAAGAAMLLAVWPLRGVFPIVPIAVGAVVYGAATLALRTPTDEERDQITSLVRRVTDRFRTTS